MKESVVVSLLGARMNYAVPRIFNDNGLLKHFYTDISANKGILKFLQLIPNKYLNEPTKKIKSRVASGIPLSKISHYPIFGVKYGINNVKAKDELDYLRNFLWGAKKFNNWVINDEHFTGNSIYAFNTAALELFSSSCCPKNKILEQTIAPYATEKKILRAERENYSQWVLKESQKYKVLETLEQEYIDREIEEMKLSTSILCGSQFVKNEIISLGIDKEKCQVVPYGISFDKREILVRKPSKKIEVLFVGRIGLRKGIQYLLESAKQLVHVANITAVGPFDVNDYALKEISKYIHLTGPVSRSHVQEYYMNADVFVLPSLCEGSATVIYEAMSFGLPIITTNNSGSIIENGNEGFIVPEHDHQKITDSILKLLDFDLRQSMAEKSLLASNNGSYDAYARRLSLAMKDKV